MGDNAIGYGFRWAKAHNGGKNLPVPEMGIVASGQAFNINGLGQGVYLRPGDPVTRLAGGGFTLCDGLEGAGGGVVVYGICVGILPYYDATIGTSGAMRPTDKLPSGLVYGTNLERQSKILIVPADAGYWEIDCDDKVTATTLAAYQAFQGENCDHTLTGATNAGFAHPRLDISDHGTATKQWRISAVSPIVENDDFAGLYVKLIVRINEAQQPGFVATGSGVGI